MNKNIIKKSNAFVFTQDQLDFICEKYFENGNTKFCEKYFEVSRYVILNAIRKNNKKIIKISDRKFYRGVKIDRTCFSDFSKEPDSYFYGLLLADGNLSKRGNMVSISLDHKDKDILIKFKSWLKSNNTFKHRSYTTREGGKQSNEVSFCFGDKIISDNLRKQGFEPNKTTREKLPKFLKNSKESERHFWRGFVDGDGHIAQRHSSILELCGSLEIMQGFTSFCSELLKKEIKTFREDCTSKNFYRVAYSGEDARKIVQYLYSDCEYFLERKQTFVQIFKEFGDKVLVKKCGLPKSEKYIRKQKNNYTLQVNGVYLGSFKSLDEARCSRDNYLKS
jgi:hypothetical protein